MQPVALELESDFTGINHPAPPGSCNLCFLSWSLQTLETTTIAFYHKMTNVIGLMKIQTFNRRARGGEGGGGGNQFLSKTIKSLKVQPIYPQYPPSTKSINQWQNKYNLYLLQSTKVFATANFLSSTCCGFITHRFIYGDMEAHAWPCFVIISFAISL